MINIVVDVYGADAGIEPVVCGVAQALCQGAQIFPVLVGPADRVDELMRQNGVEQNRYRVVDAQDYIGANEAPTCIFGQRDQSSMAIAFGILKKEEDCVAMLSAGNTGALLVGSICRLGLLQGLKFPALCSALPCASEQLLCLVDCGANMDCTAADLARFARMGNVFAKCYCGIESPRVGLMNVGREEHKGTKLSREAYDAIAQLPLRFVGNLEGSDIVSGYADVVVCDGFSGNILLKSTEAAGKAALQRVLSCDAGLTEEQKRIVTEAVSEAFEFNARGAATFLGPKKTVVKMHGCANQQTVVASIAQIERLTAADFADEMAREMSC